MNSNYPPSKNDIAKVGRIFRPVPHNSVGITCHPLSEKLNKSVFTQLHYYLSLRNCHFPYFNSSITACTILPIYYIEFIFSTNSIIIRIIYWVYGDREVPV